MKFKSFAMLAASGLLAASFAYVAPAMADDSMPDQSAQSPSSDTSAQSQTGTNVSQNGNSAPSDMSANPSSSSDEGTPDTATGDDDY